MSKDNAIYILELSDSYRITKMHAGENVFVSFFFLYQAFNDAVQTKNYSDALVIAKNMDKEHNTEHGVRVIEKYQTHTWNELVLKNTKNKNQKSKIEETKQNTT